MTTTLTKAQYALLSELRHARPDALSVEEMVERTGAPQSEVAATLSFALDRAWVVVQERTDIELSLGKDAEQLLAHGLPERRFLTAFAGRDRLPMRDAAQSASALGVKMNEVLKWGAQRGWIDKSGSDVLLTADGAAALAAAATDERALGLVRQRGPLLISALAMEGIDTDELQELVGRRPNLARLRERTFRSASLTVSGAEALDTQIRVVEQKNQLTSEDIRTGAWRDIELRPYDVTLPAETRTAVKLHPFRRILDEVRQAFLQMGFEEIVSPMAESAFWTFDALFQPQDHPARDMQDTFYLSRPGEATLPDAAIVERVRSTHEHGGDTGSLGWGYSWDSHRARQMVMRTHTTATTVRALSAAPHPPRRVFSVGRVFRNENISYKHLPEFTQVDGIVIDERGSLAALLGTLTEFYRKMGFERVKFKPAFFPYTEPSVEVFVFFESKKQWIELGGAGLFRPEVTEPLGCTVPVLAWGLGLERLAMLRYDVKDIRTLYWTDLEWLEEVPLCR